MNLDWTEEYSGENSFLKLRKLGIGSSDIASIIDLSPFKTKYRLWQEKAGIIEDDFKGNFATERGKRLEPEVRDWFNQQLHMNMIPTNRVSLDNSIFRASADGFDEKAQCLLEIKCPGMEDHTTALEVGVPEKYFPQCQWLMMVFGVSNLFYVSHNDKAENQYAIVRVQADQIYQEFLKTEAVKFWEHVVNKTEPCEPDFTDLNDPETLQLMKEYELLKDIIEESEAKIKLINEKISNKVASKGTCEGYSFSWVEKKGSISYSKIPELKDMDLEQYRGKPVRYFSIKKL